jgi:hypothetical protein
MAEYTGGIQFPVGVCAAPVVHGFQIYIQAIVTPAAGESLNGLPLWELSNLGTVLATGQLDPAGPFTWSENPIVSTMPTHAKVTAMFRNAMYQMTSVSKSTPVTDCAPPSLTMKAPSEGPMEAVTLGISDLTCTPGANNSYIIQVDLSVPGKRAFARRWDCEGVELGSEMQLTASANKRTFSREFHEDVAFSKVRVQFDGGIEITASVECQDCGNGP